MTMADETARRRTRVATSAEYDTFIGESGVPVRGSRGDDMAESNEEGCQWRQFGVMGA